LPAAVTGRNLNGLGNSKRLPHGFNLGICPCWSGRTPTEVLARKWAGPSYVRSGERKDDAADHRQDRWAELKLWQADHRWHPHQLSRPRGLQRSPKSQNAVVHGVAVDIQEIKIAQTECFFNSQRRRGVGEFVEQGRGLLNPSAHALSNYKKIGRGKIAQANVRFATPPMRAIKDSESERRRQVAYNSCHGFA
jgi:hypothetical protein